MGGIFLQKKNKAPAPTSYCRYNHWLRHIIIILKKNRRRAGYFFFFIDKRPCKTTERNVYELPTSFRNKQESKEEKTILRIVTTAGRS